MLIKILKGLLPEDYNLIRLTSILGGYDDAIGYLITIPYKGEENINDKIPYVCGRIRLFSDQIFWDNYDLIKISSSVECHTAITEYTYECDYQAYPYQYLSLHDSATFDAIKSIIFSKANSELCVLEDSKLQSKAVSTYHLPCSPLLVRLKWDQITINGLQSYSKLTSLRESIVSGAGAE